MIADRLESSTLIQMEVALERACKTQRSAGMTDAPGVAATKLCSTHGV
jgi:hypothetical protein